MPSEAGQLGESGADTSEGFSLRDICWGYRDIFTRTIKDLYEQGVLGEEHGQATHDFFAFLKNADQSCFDHVLKEFVCAVNPRTRWIVDLPGVFSDVIALGHEFAESKIHHGVTYFRIWGEGGFGDTPGEVRDLIGRLMRLRAAGDDLALAFLRGYKTLRDRLQGDHVDLYIREGLRLHHANRKHGISFMEGSSRSAENIIRSITRECRLDDVQLELSTVLRALVGHDVEVSHLGNLDSDKLIERGTSVVCMYRWLYMPIMIRHFETPGRNRAWYLLIAVVAAGMLAEKSFPSIHGHPQFRTCADLVGPDIARLNLFQLVEFTRVVERIRARWPGASNLIDFGVSTEFEQCPARTPVELLLRECLAGSVASEMAELVRDLAGRSANVVHTEAMLDDVMVNRLKAACPGAGDAPLRAVSFLPDFLFPGEVGAPPQDRLVADLRDDARRRARGEDEDDQDHTTRTLAAEEGSREVSDDDIDEQPRVQTCFVYDEWSHVEKDYYRDHCFVHEKRPSCQTQASLPSDITEDAKRVRQVFERLKPELARKEKRLQDGDAIDSDRLVSFLVHRHHEPAPPVDFYEKPLINRRDVAVLVLLDVSGSTGEMEDAEKVIDIEKRTALIFGEGLAALGDPFAVCGFSGNGRENCEYHIYKEFDAPWDQVAIGALLSARPSSSTRIGPALRHSGARLSHRDNKQRLIILITDGKPMDSGYDPGTRYAQYDVRKACEENQREGISTFAISTEENTRADMEIMFPRGRFVILPGMQHLPRVLPKLYVKLTV